mgnify:CR=1 FL=1
MSEYIVVFVTAPDADTAADMGRKLVEEGLCACVNIVPAIRSIYRWKGEICDNAESLCIIKTRTLLFEPIKKRVKELHTYEVPEIIAFKIEHGLKQYLDWIGDMTEMT